MSPIRLSDTERKKPLSFDASANKFLFLKDGGVDAAGGVKDVTAEMVEAVYGVPVDIHFHGDMPLVVTR